jgi:hypothetical protein
MLCVSARFVRFLGGHLLLKLLGVCTCALQASPPQPLQQQLTSQPPSTAPQRASVHWQQRGLAVGPPAAAYRSRWVGQSLQGHSV